MSDISRDEFEKAMKIAPERKNEDKEISTEDLDQMLKDMDNPVKSQKEIAVKIKLFFISELKMKWRRMEFSETILEDGLKLHWFA